MLGRFAACTAARAATGAARERGNIAENEGMMLRLAVGCGLAAVVAGHGALVFPRSRNAVDWQEVGCDASTDSCASNAKGNGCVNTTHPGEPCHNGQVRARVWHSPFPSHPLRQTDKYSRGVQASFWYSQGCFIG